MAEEQMARRNTDQLAHEKRRGRRTVAWLAGLLLVALASGCSGPRATPAPSVATPTPGMMGAAAEPGHLRHGDPLPDVGIPPATATQGGQLLAYREEDGVKVFELTSRLVKWHILPDVQVTAMTYNGTVPGPEIRVTQGDRVKVLLKNELPYPTTIHWHGILVPNNMDGVPDMTQAPAPPGGSFTYEFTAEPAGTYWYHSHVQTDAQVLTGLYAPFIIEPKEPTDPRPDVDVTLMLSEWRVIGGQTFPAMPMSGMDPNYFTINGKAFPTKDAGGQGVDGATVTLKADMIGHSMGNLSGQATGQANGRYATRANLSMAGEWQVDVQVKTADKDVSRRFKIVVQ